MGELTIVLDEATDAALSRAAQSAGVSRHKWLLDLIRRYSRAEADPAILIVDDDPVFREVLRCHAEHFGWSADTAENGAEALALLAERRYRLLLTDCRMPVMDGLQLVHALRARERRRGEPPLPAIAVSTERVPAGAPFDECLTKPPAAQVLGRLFSRWLGAGAGGSPAAAGGSH
ncbi:MAG: response regulator [Rhodocyclaceae bacterium]|nr:response regulator [Rhodocyclaceae bacterium]